MAGMTPWVRQYKLRDLLDDSFDLFRERASTLLLAGVAPALLVVGFVALMLQQMPGNFRADFTAESLDEMHLSAEFWYFIVSTYLVSWIAFSFAYIAQLRIAVAQALGLHRTFTDALKLMAKPFWSLLVASLVFGVIASVVSLVIIAVAFIIAALFAGIGSLLGEDVGAYIGVSIGALIGVTGGLMAFCLIATFFVFTPVVLAQDHRGPFAAIGRSFRMASANYKMYYWSLVTYLHIPMLFLPLIVWIVMALQFLGSSVEASLGATLFMNVVSTLATIVFMAMLACAQALMYIDARCRIEGFDLVMLAQSLGLGDEVEQALLQAAYKPAVAAYPNYAATPATPGLTQPRPAAGYPDYAAPPVPGAAVYPDYAAPPPDYTAPPPVVTDYTAPPPVTLVSPAPPAPDDAPATDDAAPPPVIPVDVAATDAVEPPPASPEREDAHAS